MADTWTKRWDVPGSNGKAWTVGQKGDGSFGCSCPAWKFACAPKPDCHHILQVRALLDKGIDPKLAENKVIEQAPTMGLPVLEHPRCEAPFREECFSSPAWHAERKYDGARAYLYFEGGAVRTVMRSGHDRTASFRLPYVADLEGTILDGEIYHPQGFNKTLSGVLGSRSEGLIFAVFDIQFWCGDDLRREPLTRRRAFLMDALAHLDGQPVELVLAVAEHKREFFEAELAAGREGVILKKVNCGYGIEWAKKKAERDTSVILLGPAPDHGERAAKIGVLYGSTFAHHPDERQSRDDGGRILELGTIKLGSREARCVAPGSVVDVRALSFDLATQRFRQPRFVRARPDLAPDDCTLARVAADFGVQ